LSYAADKQTSLLMRLTNTLNFLLTRQTDRQTNKQTDGLEHPTHADQLCRRGKRQYETAQYNYLHLQIYVFKKILHNTVTA